MGQAAVVRQEEQPLGVEIEPADGKHPLRISGDVIADAGPAFGVVHGGDDVPGLYMARYTAFCGLTGLPSRVTRSLSGSMLSPREAGLPLTPRPSRSISSAFLREISPVEGKFVYPYPWHGATIY